jgi:RloB-like protein
LSNSLRRKVGTRPERRRILIVTEGARTEPTYFRGLARHLRATGTEVCAVTVVGIGKDPRRVVEDAIRRQQRAPRDDRYDLVWCAVDLDDHDTLAAALTLARQNSVNVAVSSACFEIWLLWHFVDRAGYATCAQLRMLLRQHGCPEKTMPETFDYSRYVAAAARAEASDPAAAQGRIGRNPSTAVHLIVADLVLRLR